MDRDRIAGAAKDMAGKVESTAGEITGDPQAQAAGEVREATGTVQNLYGQAKDQVRDAAREMGKTASHYARDAYGHGGESLREGSRSIARRVQNNPFGALLVAGSIGFTLALLMTRQPRRPPPRWRYYG